MSSLTLWQDGLVTPPGTTTISNPESNRILAQNAIIPAGVNGAIQAYSSGATHMIIDVNGYFDTNVPNGLVFFPGDPLQNRGYAKRNRCVWWACVGR